MDILTLHSGPLSKITSVTNKIGYIIKWFFNNPGFISDAYEETLISYREIAGTYGDDVDTLLPAVSNALQTVMAKVIPEETIVVDVTKTDIDVAYYRLEIMVTNEVGNILLLKSSIDIKDSVITINSRL